MTDLEYYHGLRDALQIVTSWINDPKISAAQIQVLQSVAGDIEIKIPQNLELVIPGDQNIMQARGAKL